MTAAELRRETPEHLVPDRAERNCTYRFPDSGWQCAALPSDEVHVSATCEFGHPETHHKFDPEPSR